MLIDADSNQATGKDGVDYQVELQWNNKYKTWIKFFTEYSSEGYRRELSTDTNYTHFFEGEVGHYVLLSANLNAMSFPNKYKVMFYSEIIHNINNPTHESIEIETNL
jgi:hypothetical protein